MYLGCRFLPIRVHGIVSYHLINKYISSVSMYPSTVKVGLRRTQGLHEADEILGSHLNEAVAWGVNVRDQHERNGH